MQKKEREREEKKGRKTDSLTMHCEVMTSSSYMGKGKSKKRCLLYKRTTPAFAINVQIFVNLRGKSAKVISR